MTKLIGIVMRKYPYGDDRGGSEHGIHLEKLYIGDNLKSIFWKILHDFGILEELGETYARIYKDDLDGSRTISRANQNSMNIEYQFIDFYYTQIETSKISVNELKDILFWGESRFGDSNEPLVFYKIVEATQNEDKLNALKEEYSGSIDWQYGLKEE